MYVSDWTTQVLWPLLLLHTEHFNVVAGVGAATLLGSFICIRAHKSCDLLTKYDGCLMKVTNMIKSDKMAL